MAKLLSFLPRWITSLESTNSLGFSWNTLKVTPTGLFIDYRTLLVLNRLHQSECIHVTILTIKFVRTWGTILNDYSSRSSSQILIYSKSSPCLVNVGLIVCTNLNNPLSDKESEPASFFAALHYTVPFRCTCAYACAAQYFSLHLCLCLRPGLCL